jgi:uncharacterized protein YgiM (DUF1202 family)
MFAPKIDGSLSCRGVARCCALFMAAVLVASPFRATAEDLTEIVNEIKAAAAGEKTVPNEFPETGFISDPDGFTNVRSGPGTDYEVIAVIKLNESFGFRRDRGSWWRVKTKSGTVGFVHASRIPTNEKQSSVWLFADSSSWRLMRSELERLTADDLWRARNELFARNGLIFQTAKGRRLADQIGSSYAPVTSDQEAVFAAMSPIEKDNIKLIQSVENSHIVR